MLKLNNLENQEQKELLEATLKELPSDDLWDENNSIERTNKKLKLKRYLFDKRLGTMVGKAEEDMDTLQGEQDMTKWAKKHGVPLLDMDSAPSASTQLSAVIKAEHKWVVPAEAMKNSLANSQKQVRILVSTFKRLRGLFGSASYGYEEDAKLSLLSWKRWRPI